MMAPQTHKFFPSLLQAKRGLDITVFHKDNYSIKMASELSGTSLSWLSTSVPSGHLAAAHLLRSGGTLLPLNGGQS